MKKWYLLNKTSITPYINLKLAEKLLVILPALPSE